MMIYVFFANGFEEIEGLAVVDILRRAKLNVLTVGIGGRQITGSHEITIICDKSENEVNPENNLEAVVLPGGMPGTLNLEKSETVQSFIDYASRNNKLVCAICAAPSVLGHKELLKGRQATCFPGFEKDLKGANVSKDFVVSDKNFITAKGAGSAIKFAVAIAERFVGNMAHEIEESLQCP